MLRNTSIGADVTYGPWHCLAAQAGSGSRQRASSRTSLHSKLTLTPNTSQSGAHVQEAEKAVVRQVQEQVQDVGTGLGDDRPVSQRTDDAETHEKGSRDALLARARHHATAAVRQPLATDWPMVAFEAVRLLDVDCRRNSRIRGQR